MGSILKKLNSKWNLLFLCMFFGLSMHAQYSENEALNDWIKNALEQDYDSYLKTNIDDDLIFENTYTDEEYIDYLRATGEDNLCASGHTLNDMSHTNTDAHVVTTVIKGEDDGWRSFMDDYNNWVASMEKEEWEKLNDYYNSLYEEEIFGDNNGAVETPTLDNTSNTTPRGETCRGCDTAFAIDTGPFPNTLRTIDKIKTYVLNHPKILSEFIELSGLSREKALALLEPNIIKSMLRIKVLPENGLYDHKTPNLFYVDKSKISSLELGKYEDVFGTKEDINGVSFFVAVTILHELVHYGRFQNGLPNKVGVYEAGQYFETVCFYQVLGIRGSTNKAKENGWSF